MIIKLNKVRQAYIRDGHASTSYEVLCNRAICARFVSKELGFRPKKISVAFRTKNPKRPGWTKGILYKGRCAAKLNDDSRRKNALYSKAFNFLRQKAGYKPFWFKITEAS